MSVFLKVVSVSQRGKKNRCVGIGLCFKGTEKAERKARLTVGEDKVFGDDFADVDLREELCYHSRPKKRKFRVYVRRKKSKKESPDHRRGLPLWER